MKENNKTTKKSVLIHYFLEGFYIGLVIGGAVAVIAFIYHTFFNKLFT